MNHKIARAEALRLSKETMVKAEQERKQPAISHWQDKPDKVGYWWLFNERKNVVLVIHNINNHGFEVLNNMGLFPVENYGAKWLYIEQPEAPEVGGK
jgi:hypothetical protein